MSILDAIAVDSVHLWNLLYLPCMLYLFTAIMDTKQAKLAASFFPMFAVVFSVLAIYIYLLAQVLAITNKPAPSFTEPLYVPH